MDAVYAGLGLHAKDLRALASDEVAIQDIMWKISGVFRRGSHLKVGSERDCFRATFSVGDPSVAEAVRVTGIGIHGLEARLHVVL